jgi:3-hydroxyisobutyrate dehydrogenase
LDKGHSAGRHLNSEIAARDHHGVGRADDARKMIERDFQPAFAVKHQQKDLAILLSTARATGIPLPGAALVHQLLSALEAQGRGGEGTQALLTLYEQMAKPPEA